jgi:SWIRM domain
LHSFRVREQWRCWFRFACWGSAGLAAVLAGLTRPAARLAGSWLAVQLNEFFIARARVPGVVADFRLRGDIVCDGAGTTFTRQELDTFRQNLDEYAHIRGVILPLWMGSHGKYLSFDDCVDAKALAKITSRNVVARVFNFLQRNGYINWGLPESFDAFYIPAGLRHKPGQAVTPAAATAVAHMTLAYANMEVRLVCLCCKHFLFLAGPG